MNNEKMIKLAGNLDLFAKVCGGIFYAFAIICMIFAGLVFVFEESMIAELSITLDFIKLYFNESVNVNMTFMKYYMMVGLIMVGVFSFVIAYVLKMIRSILACMKEGRPFEKNVPEVLRKIAYFVLGGGILTQIIHGVEAMLIAKAIPLDELLLKESITKIEYTFTADFSFVLIFAILMFLSYIFAYGVQLQIESDETL